VAISGVTFPRRLCHLAFASKFELSISPGLVSCLETLLPIVAILRVRVADGTPRMGDLI
jgi:hypothetical protein